MKWREIFDRQPFIGNYEKPGAPADKVARGFYFYEPTKREWAIMVQDFFNDKITSQEFATKYQKLLDGIKELCDLGVAVREYP